MNPEIINPNNKEKLSYIKIPVSELLKLAGESFDNFGDEYTKTHNRMLLNGKKQILEEILNGCEKYGSDWEKYKEIISKTIESLLAEIDELIKTGSFSMLFDRVGYSRRSHRHQMNSLYELAENCSEIKSEDPTNNVSDASSE
jgi:hypothetical protein